MIPSESLPQPSHLIDETNSWFSAVIESCQDAIISANSEGIIMSWNRAAESIFGYQSGEALGKQVTILIPSDRQAEETTISARVMRGERIAEFETVCIHKDGHPVPLLLTYSPIKDRGGNVLGASVVVRKITDNTRAGISTMNLLQKLGTLMNALPVGVTFSDGLSCEHAVDITDKKRAEQILIQDAQTGLQREKELELLVNERTAALREVNSQLEEFSHAISHDLRAPLRAMHGYASAVLDDCSTALDGTARDYLQRIINASIRMDRLIVDVLNYSKIPGELPNLEKIQLEKLIPRVLLPYTEEPQHSAEIIIKPPLLQVLGNELLLEQAITNLVSNSIKYSASDRPNKISISTERRGNLVRINVQDTGIGIKPEDQERVWVMFERLHTRSQYEGNGIGLATVRKSVEKMKGTCGLESDGVTGSKFWIELNGAPWSGEGEALLT